MFSELLDWLSSIFDNEVEAPIEEVDVADTDIDVDDVDGTDPNGDSVDSGNSDIVADIADVGTTEPGSVDDILNKGITTDSVTDEELAELQGKKEPTFTGHTAVQCNVCGCDCFIPTSNDPKRCKCGHSIYQHEWKS